MRNHLGDPAARDFVSSDGDPFFEPTVSGHPLFAGLPEGRIQVLAGDEWGAYFTGYSGIELARFGTNELGVLGDRRGLRAADADERAAVAGRRSGRARSRARLPVGRRTGSASS